MRDGRHGPGQSSYKNIHTYILIPSHKRCLYMEYLNSCAVASLMLVQGPHGGPNSPMDLTPCRNFPICLIVTIITTSRFISYRIRPSDGAWLRVDRLYVDFYTSCIHLIVNVNIALTVILKAFTSSRNLVSLTAHRQLSCIHAPIPSAKSVYSSP